MQNYNSKFKIKSIFVIVIVLLQFIVINKNCFALSLVQSLGSCGASGDCELHHFVMIAIWVWNWILGISGSLALLFFIYGGFTFLISGGSSERIAKGKTILINSIIGLAIIFCSYMIINFILVKLGYINAGTWFNVTGPTYQGY
jgi:hypothetical protein